MGCGACRLGLPPGEAADVRVIGSRSSGVCAGPAAAYTLQALAPAPSGSRLSAV
jgi:hypothetical protein